MVPKDVRTGISQGARITTMFAEAIENDKSKLM
jgi:hypothetical protein